MAVGARWAPDPARRVGLELAQSSKPPRDWYQCLPWGKSGAQRGPVPAGPGGRGDAASPCALPRAPRMSERVFPPKHLPAIPPARGAWAARLPPSPVPRRKRGWVWGALGPRKPLLGRRGNEKMRKRQSSCWGAGRGAGGGEQSPPWLPICFPGGSVCPVPCTLSTPWVPWGVKGGKALSLRHSQFAPCWGLCLWGPPQRHALAPAPFHILRWVKARCALAAHTGPWVLKSWTADFL